MEKLSKFQKLILILGFISTTALTYSTYMIHKASCIDFSMGLYSFRISSDIGNIEGVLEDIKTEILNRQFDLDNLKKSLEDIEEAIKDGK